VRQIAAPPDPIIEKHFENFRKKHVTPDGWPLSDSLSVYRHANELGSGMYLRWDPRPPNWWLGPRSNFCAFVREKVEDSRLRLDTELAVARAFPDAPEVTDWQAVKPLFEPNSVPVWLSDSVLRACANWIASSAEPGILWAWNVAFGTALATMTGLRYYGAGGYDQYGSHISKLACYGAGARKGVIPSIILSGQANMRGRNLQSWARNGIVSPPRSARFLEQVFGRTHRSGQERPVSFDFIMTSGDTFDGFAASMREAGFGKAVFGLTQKLLRATVVDIPRPSGEKYRWQNEG